MVKKNKSVSLLKSIGVLALLLIPLFLVYKNLFIGSITWGDAPYFYPEAFKDLIREPLSWTERGVNFGGSYSR